MIRLVRSESRRFWSRRITWFFPGILALLIGAGILIAFVVISNDDGNSPDFVRDMAGGVEATGLTELLTILLPVMGFVVGASYIGADLKTGMIEQLLTWEPRRHRLVFARSLACFSGVAVLAAALAILMILLMYLLATATGTSNDIPTELWVNAAQAIARTGFSAGMFSIIGLGLTFAVNSSLGSIVGFVIYRFIGEGIVLVFLSQVGVWLPVENGNAFATGVDVERVTGGAFSENGPSFVTHHGYLTAGAVLAAWTLLSLVVGAVIFERRDVA